MVGPPSPEGVLISLLLGLVIGIGVGRTGRRPRTRGGLVAVIVLGFISPAIGVHFCIACSGTTGFFMNHLLTGFSAGWLISLGYYWLKHPTGPAKSV